LNEDDEDYFAMMASMERRQSTHPRKLALASAERASRRVLRREAQAGDRASEAHAWRPPNPSSGQDSQRMVFLNAQDDPEFQEDLKHFSGNRVKTGKYNAFTFLPLFLIEMFSRAAYAYFLCQVRKPNPSLTHRWTPQLSSTPHTPAMRIARFSVHSRMPVG
jgi:hypothetical protein